LTMTSGKADKMPIPAHDNLDSPNSPLGSIRSQEKPD
jgi:hypothetical protein